MSLPNDDDDDYCDDYDDNDDATYPECDHDEYQLPTGQTDRETKTFIRAHALSQRGLTRCPSVRQWWGCNCSGGPEMAAASPDLAVLW